MGLPEPVSHVGDGAWLLRVWAQPGAKRDEVAGLYQGCLKIRLGAPAVDNKANKALVRFVASALALRQRQVTLRDGHASRQKTLLIESEQEPRWETMVPAGAEKQ
ncbi:MAG: DUF167 domain-containing protein [Desulfovibrio sp.]